MDIQDIDYVKVGALDWSREHHWSVTLCDSSLTTYTSVIVHGSPFM